MSRDCHSIARLRECANLSAQPLRHGVCSDYEYVQIKIAQSLGRVLMKRNTMLALVCAMLFFAAGPARAASKGSKARQLTICQNTEFALCAASTCVATGGMVKNSQGKKYPAVSCECPIVVGDNIADLNGGNMKGSCTSSDPISSIRLSSSPILSHS